MSEIGGFKRVIERLERLTGPLGVTGKYLAAHEQQWLEMVVNGYGELLEREDRESTSGESDGNNAPSVTWVQIEREAGPLANDIFSVIGRLESLGEASLLMLSKIEDIDLSSLDIDCDISNKEKCCIDLAQRAMRSLDLRLWLNDHADLINELRYDEGESVVDCSKDDLCGKVDELRYLATIFKKLADFADLRKGKPLWIEGEKKITESKCIEWLVGEIIKFNTSRNITGKSFPMGHVVAIAQVIHDGIGSPKAIRVFDTGWGVIEFNRIKARMKKFGNGAGIKAGSSLFEIGENDSVNWIQEPARQKIKASKEVIHRAPRTSKKKM